MLLWCTDYLKDMKQHVVLTVAISNWSLTKAGVPQGVILGPMLFSVIINDPAIC